jgi:lysophospholipase L1-like esterase
MLLKVPRSAALVITSLALVACQGAGPTASTSTPTTASASPPGPTAAPSDSTPGPSPAGAGWTLVALGDSETTGSGDRSGQGWVAYYADLIRASQRREVTVTNLAANGTTSDQLLGSVHTNEQVRERIAAADIVVLGIGGADVNAGDDALAAGSCDGTACYDPAIRAYAANIDDIAAAITTVRAGKPTVLRAITMPNVLTGAEDVIPPFLSDIATEVGVHQARGFNAATCGAMEAHGGACIDVLTAFNGPGGSADGYAAGLLNLEDCCYPNERGHRLIAELLYDTGLAPLVAS